MSSPAKRERRVIMARRVAAKWLQRTAKAEYRFEVLAGAPDLRHIPNMLRAFRDGKIAVEGVPLIPDLGIRDRRDTLVLWSKDRTGVMALKDWFESRGYETSGVW
jgi:hypothetical protein